MEPALVMFGLAAAIALAARPLKMRLLRRTLDVHSSRNAGMREAMRVAGIGTRARAGGLFSERHRASLGVRLLSTVIVLYLVSIVRAHGPVLLGVDPSHGGLLTLGSGFLALWYLFFIWRYEVVLDGPELRFTSLRGGTARRDLRGLIAVEGDSGYMLRLYFRDQRQAEIIATVADAAGLRDKLNAHLSAGARTR